MVLHVLHNLEVDEFAKVTPVSLHHECKSSILQQCAVPNTATIPDESYSSLLFVGNASITVSDPLPLEVRKRIITLKHLQHMVLFNLTILECFADIGLATTSVGS